MDLRVKKLNLDNFTHAASLRQNSSSGLYPHPQTEENYSFPSRQCFFENLSPLSAEKGRLCVTSLCYESYKVKLNQQTMRQIINT